MRELVVMSEGILSVSGLGARLTTPARSGLFVKRFYIIWPEGAPKMLMPYSFCFVYCTFGAGQTRENGVCATCALTLVRV